jgi:hypothetical protein
MATFVVSRRTVFRRLPLKRFFSSENPLQVIQNATSVLQDASSRLESIGKTIQTPLTLNTGQEATVKDIVLHSRDSKPAEFQERVAKDARALVLPIAESIEEDLKELAAFYRTTVRPQVERATLICKDTPCGGVTWEIDFAANVDSKVQIEGKDTPCGRLQDASFSFLQVTHDTKEHVLLGSRGALILRLAKELDSPLSFVRASDDKERKARIGKVFAEQVVATPWLRSDEEYEQFSRVKQELADQA